MKKYKYASLTIILCALLGALFVLRFSYRTEPATDRTVGNYVVLDTFGQEDSSEAESGGTDASAGEEKEPEIGGDEVEMESPAEVQDEPETMTVLMVGDILLHTRVEDSARREDGSYDYDAIFAHTYEDIRAADLAIVNQEVIIGGVELGISGYPNFNAPDEIGNALVKAGFDVVCHATNHALDKNAAGVTNTLNFWRTHYPEIGVVGMYDSAEAQQEIYTCERNGITVAILNYTYGTNGIPLPEEMPFAVNLLDRERVAADLARAEELADFTIVVPHWGIEYALTASAEQEMWAQLFVKNGADLILGAHPHVIEPVQWVEDEESHQRALVYYSVGNFVSWSGEYVAGVANRMVGGMAEVTLERQEDGTVVIADYGIEPVVCHVEEGSDGVTVYKLSDYTAELADRSSIIAQDAAFSYEYCRELCTRVWEELYP